MFLTTGLGSVASTEFLVQVVWIRSLQSGFRVVVADPVSGADQRVRCRSEWFGADRSDSVWIGILRCGLECFGAGQVLR